MQSVESAAASVGARVLGEIDETSLEEILASLRTGFATATATTNHDRVDDTEDGSAFTSALSAGRLREFPVPRLDGIVQRHLRVTQSAPLVIGGRYHELLYILIATLISAPHSKAVSVVDFEGRFDLLRLIATPPVIQEGEAAFTTALRRADLDHVHILRLAAGDAEYVANAIAHMEEYMLYAPHCSRDREWWGAVVIGGGLNPAGGTPGGGHVAVIADRRGWLRIDHAEIPQFLDVAVEDAMADRDNRQRAVQETGWVGSSQWGSLVFGRIQKRR